MFTKVSSPLDWNFSEDTLPVELRAVEMFLIDNPIARQKQYLVLKSDKNRKKLRMSMRKAVLAGEERALEVLVNLFDWLDGLESQPTTGLDGLESQPTTGIVYLDDTSSVDSRGPPPSYGDIYPPGTSQVVSSAPSIGTVGSAGRVGSVGSIGSKPDGDWSSRKVDAYGRWYQAMNRHQPVCAGFIEYCLRREVTDRDFSCHRFRSSKKK